MDYSLRSRAFKKNHVNHLKKALKNKKTIVTFSVYVQVGVPKLFLYNNLTIDSIKLKIIFIYINFIVLEIFYFLRY